MTDPSLATFLELRTELYAAAGRHRKQLAEIAQNDALIAEASVLRPDPAKWGELEHENNRVRGMLLGLLRENDVERPMVDAAHVLAFPHVTVDDFGDAFEATHQIPGLPVIFDRLPFPVCLFGFGTGVVLKRDGEEDLRIALGFLAARDGLVWTVMRTDAGKLNLVRLCVDGDWEVPSIAIGWLLHALLTAIEACPPAMVVPASSLSLRRLQERAVKAGAPHRSPPAYYEVRIGDEQFRSIVRSVTHEPIEFSHRWDVRQHCRRRFLRGTGTLAPETSAALVERGYVVHIPTDPEVANALAVRGLPAPRPGEWIASKTWRVREHVKGPDDKPYVPSMRVVA